MITRPTASLQGGDECRHETPSGAQYICQPEYGEILLLASEEGPILRAYPLPAVPPQFIRLSGDAVYCARQGDGGLPDSMACRIDRRTFAATVRVFPSEMDSGFVGTTEAYAPKSWSVDGHELEVYDFVVTEKGAWAKDFEGTWTQLRPTDLGIVAQNKPNPS